MLIDHEDRVTGWRGFGHNGFAEVRIWERRTPFGLFQRHEWRREDGSTQVDEWIVTPRRSFSLNTAPTAEREPTEAERAVEALRSIAAGHNDARGLAQAVLDAIGK